MKPLKTLTAITLLVSFCLDLTSYAQTIGKPSVAARAVLKNMSLKEKIGQKLMLDFRYWCTENPKEGKACTQDFTQMNETVQQFLSENHIGGVILFANNLKNIKQIATLTNDFQNTMTKSNGIPLLIGTDQEGGIVTRLPRDVTVSFPGNMAITAAYLGSPNKAYSRAVGSIMARDLKALGMNVDFAPDVDVNVNPLNPVINVRSFSDDPQLVSQLGLELSQAIQKEGIASTLKHFPGHGDTITDSHIGLPLVNHNQEEAWAIDLYPFKHIIQNHSPDLIMTAHIQYPALDDTLIYAGKSEKEINTPATLSRKIQFDLLRKQLGYQGVVITDALGMGAIAEHFDPVDATIKSFQAGDDIALMPISLTGPQDIDRLRDLIATIEAAVQEGKISEQELNESVLRILQLKIKLGLFQPDLTPLSEKISRAQKIIADPAQHELERGLADDAITLVQNTNQLIPIKPSANTRIHILTPWLEQSTGIAKEIERLQKEQFLPQRLQVQCVKMADTDFETEKQFIDDSDIILVGASTTKSLPVMSMAIGNTLQHSRLQSLAFPEMLTGDSLSYSPKHPLQALMFTRSLPDPLFAYKALQYARSQHKKTIFLSLLAPYDLANYSKVADAMLAGYDFYGYFIPDQKEGYYRGPSMQALTRIIFGYSQAVGKLPIQIPDPKNPTDILYPRGYGLLSYRSQMH